MTFLLAILLAAPALAADADDPPGVWLAEARALARQGQSEGARQSARVALEMPGDHQRQAQLLIAATYEQDGRLDEALALYDALADAYPAKDVPVALRLRLATVHGAQARYRKARRTLRPLRRDADLPPDRQLQVRMLEGLWDLERGKDERGLATVTEALAMPAASPWWRAQGHHALCRYAVDLAVRFPAGRTPEALQEALQTRAELVGMAKQQTVHLLNLDQPEIAREALVSLADLHEQTGIDVLTITEDPSDPRVEGLWLRALDYVDRSERLAQRTGAPPTVLAEIVERRTRLESRIESL